LRATSVARERSRIRRGRRLVLRYEKTARTFSNFKKKTPRRDLPPQRPSAGVMRGMNLALFSSIPVHDHGEEDA
jgi:hypothetical protein